MLFVSFLLFFINVKKLYSHRTLGLFISQIASQKEVISLSYGVRM